MMRRLSPVLTILLLVALACQAWAALPAPPDTLAKYVARPDATTRWEVRGQENIGGTTMYDVLLTSQTWKGITWRHNLAIFVPARVTNPHHALMLISGGGGDAATRKSGGGLEGQLGPVLANSIGAPMALLTHVPNQPLFGGMVEDDIIAHTYLQYLDGGDDDWPLLLPMAKSAVKAMDAIQAVCKQKAGLDIQGFVVTGASKRGWTTWLTAASGDKRVKGIAPMVIDMLNLMAQMPHQYKMFGGKYSQSIDEYTKRGIQPRFATPRGQKLLSIVDPYSYRATLTLPKLLIHGANDQFWATDAATLYWNDLVGEKAIMYAPNTTHSIEKDLTRVMEGLTAFFWHVAAGKPFPQPTWQWGESGDKITLRMTSTLPISEGRVWLNANATSDFRESQWVSTPLRLEGGALVGEIAKPAGGYLALIGEAAYQVDGRPLRLSTTPFVYPPVK